MNTWTFSGTKSARRQADFATMAETALKRTNRRFGIFSKRYRATTAALTLFTLAGCSEVPGASLLADIRNSTQKDVALSQASMAFGAVTLVPPPGFCIDKRTLRPEFAIMARCDTLGVPSAAGEAPLGVLVASFAAAADGSGLPDPETIEAALGLSSVAETVQTDESVTFRAMGGTSPAGTASVHWRGAARVGNQLMGLALYGPDGGRALGEEGRALLTAVIDGSEPTS